MRELRQRGRQPFSFSLLMLNSVGIHGDPSSRYRFSPYIPGLIKTIKLSCQDERVCFGESCSPRPFLFESNGGGIAAVLVAVRWNP